MTGIVLYVEVTRTVKAELLTLKDFKVKELYIIIGSQDLLTW